jgi:hypothetical protein
MNLEILPLAITMMVGPAIMASIIFVTHEQLVRVSLAYLLGVTIGTVLGVAIAMGLARLLGDNVSGRLLGAGIGRCRAALAGVSAFPAPRESRSAEGAGLDQREQLGGEHRHQRPVHPPDPRLGGAGPRAQEM